MTGLRLVSHTCEYSVLVFKFQVELQVQVQVHVQVQVDDVAAPLPQATQLYGTANEDVEEESEIDEAVRCAPFWQATQQYGGSSAGDDAEIDDDDAVRRCGWPDAQLAESPRGLAAIWAACGLEMDDELTGGPSAAREEAECMSEMAPDV